VKAKLAAAEQAGPPCTRNVKALVQPEDVLPGDIDANLGHHGYPNPTSRHSLPNCSMSILRVFR
jgi:N12 class adenine-specific DNA methylase